MPVVTQVRNLATAVANGDMVIARWDRVRWR
jgi:hypothetical protein